MTNFATKTVDELRAILVKGDTIRQTQADAANAAAELAAREAAAELERAKERQKAIAQEYRKLEAAIKADFAAYAPAARAVLEIHRRLEVALDTQRQLAREAERLHEAGAPAQPFGDSWAYSDIRHAFMPLKCGKLDTEGALRYYADPGGLPQYNPSPWMKRIYGV